MESKKQDYETAISYETERVSAYEKTMNAFQESIQLSLQEIKEYKLRVEQMREVSLLCLCLSLP
jgi:flagellar assembly factor FliW